MCTRRWNTLRHSAADQRRGDVVQNEDSTNTIASMKPPFQSSGNQRGGIFGMLSSVARQRANPSSSQEVGQHHPLVLRVPDQSDGRCRHEAGDQQQQSVIVNNPDSATARGGGGTAPRPAKSAQTEWGRQERQAGPGFRRRGGCE
jgi:hypothetical protein